MGRMGARDFLSLVAIVVLRTAVSNRLAKVQGFLFHAAFLRRVPSFFRLIFENILLCFLQSTLLSTSKYVTGTLSLQFRKILTKLIHAQYFQVKSDGSSMVALSLEFSSLMLEKKISATCFLGKYPAYHEPVLKQI